jgi:exonuclease VII small subunit
MESQKEKADYKALLDQAITLLRECREATEHNEQYIAKVKKKIRKIEKRTQEASRFLAIIK